MVWALSITGPVHPQRAAKNQHEQEKEDARNLKPHNAANAAEGAQKAADAARDPSRGSSSGLTGSMGLGGGSRGSRLGGGTVDGRVGACCDAFTGHSPGHP